MKQVFTRKTLVASMAAGFAMALGGCGGGGSSDPVVEQPVDAVMSSIKSVPTVKNIPFDWSTNPAVCSTTSRSFSTMLCSRGEVLVDVDGAMVPDPEGKKPLGL